jgi:hypothetical protein
MTPVDAFSTMRPWTSTSRRRNEAPDPEKLSFDRDLEVQLFEYRLLGGCCPRINWMETSGS